MERNDELYKVLGLPDNIRANLKEQGADLGLVQGSGLWKRPLQRLSGQNPKKSIQCIVTCEDTG